MEHLIGRQSHPTDVAESEAEAHAAEDAKRKEEAETRNTSDNLAYQAEKTVRDNKDKIPEDIATEITSKVEALRTAITANDVARMKSASEELSTSLQKAGSHVYGQSGQQQPPPAGGEQQPGGEGGPPPGGKPDEGTVEGEFREV